MDPFICFIYFYILFSRWTMEFFNIIGLYTIQRRFFSSPLMMAINSDLMIVWGVGKRHFFGLHKLHIIGYSTVIYITHCVSWLFSSQKMESIRLLRSDGWWLQGTIDLRSAKNWGLWARMGNKKTKPAWWFGTMEFDDFPFSCECHHHHHPNWRTPSFFRGVGQPPTRNKSK
jgi:hypothetical protein